MEIKCPKTNEVVQVFRSGPSGMVSRLLSDFEELKPLGSGGYGFVVKVLNKIDGQQYALKKIRLSDPDLGYNDLVREVRAISRLTHPNIVRYFSAWLEKDTIGLIDDLEGSSGDDSSVGFCVADGKEKGSMLCIQQELCYGLLEDIMTDLTEDRIKSMFWDMVKGVAYMHGKGVIHGDLSPKNIFLDEEKQNVKIGDFGLADLSKKENRPPTTPYKAPELHDPSVFTAKSDIYSLGVILLEMTAKFSGQSERARQLSKFKDDNTWPESLESADSETKLIIEVMTKRDPEQRPTADDVLKVFFSA